MLHGLNLDGRFNTLSELISAKREPLNPCSEGQVFRNKTTLHAAVYLNHYRRGYVITWTRSVNAPDSFSLGISALGVSYLKIVEQFSKLSDRSNDNGEVLRGLLRERSLNLHDVDDDGNTLLHVGLPFDLPRCQCTKLKPS